MEKNVMAVVNGVEILESDVDRFTELMGNRALPYKSPEGKKQLCEELVKQELIIQDCYNRKLDESEAFVKEINEIKRSILAKHFLSELFDDIKASDEEIKEYYEENKNLFMSKYSFKAKHILVESEEKANELKNLCENGESFEELAMKHSMCPSKEVGGDLGEFSQGQMVLEFENACIDAEVGKVTEPVKTQFGYHLIKLESKTDPKELSLEEVRDEIEKTIIKAKEQIAYVQKMDALMKDSKIERAY
ncbi:peptidylprolyl isomerase [uncultured Parvimonas sp.]|uniref:peptidylprolyl isomerase n=1 Tax=uncultured Parvimonas sp. TaxID=747372 RepID=UPI002594C599|nr:peptidylprolyl isomerase [uncultured Parvimonas sp.]